MTSEERDKYIQGWKMIAEGLRFLPDPYLAALHDTLDAGMYQVYDQYSEVPKDLMWQIANILQHRRKEREGEE